MWRELILVEKIIRTSISEREDTSLLRWRDEAVMRNDIRKQGKENQRLALLKPV